MTFPDWLATTDGQDALTEAMFGDRVQRKRALESAWRAGHIEASAAVDVDDLELSLADLPEGA